MLFNRYEIKHLPFEVRINVEWIARFCKRRDAFDERLKSRNKTMLFVVLSK